MGFCRPVPRPVVFLAAVPAGAGICAPELSDRLHAKADGGTTAVQDPRKPCGPSGPILDPLHRKEHLHDIPRWLCACSSLRGSAPEHRLCLTLLFIIQFCFEGCGGVYSRSYSLQQKAAQTPQQTRSCNVLTLNYLLHFRVNFPSR